MTLSLGGKASVGGGGASLEVTDLAKRVIFYDPSTSRNAGDVYDNWQDCYDLARAHADAGGLADILIGGSFNAEIDTPGMDLTGILVKGDKPNQYVKIMPTATITGGPPAAFQDLFLWLQSGRTEPLFGTRTSSVQLYLLGTGGIFASASYTGHTPSVVQQDDSVFVVTSVGYHEILSLGGVDDALFSNGAEGQLDILFRNTGTFYLDCVKESGEFCRVRGPKGGLLLANDPVAAASGMVVEYLANDIYPRWANLEDQGYIDTPVNIPSGATIQLEVDGLGANTTTGGAYQYMPWDTSTNLIKPKDGDRFMVRVSVELTQNTAGNDELNCAIDIGGAGDIIIAADRFSSTQNGATFTKTFEFELFALSTFEANGGRIELTASGGDFDVSKASIFIQER